jgi:maleylacetate reductase
MSGFRHVDAERTIVFGGGALDVAGDLLGDGYTLLTTERAREQAAAVVERARDVVDVPGGLVEVVAADLRSRVEGRRLVALGGGRVIDVAKALAAADGPREVLAIPTSLSAAEMTGVHRHANGVPAGTPRVRPRVVVNDPALSASQPPEQLAASTANALGHATVGLLSDRTTPPAQAVARAAITHLAAGWATAEPDRARLALGALLAGWAVDHSGLGPHHALAQTAVRIAGIPHAQANAALLPGNHRGAPLTEARRRSRGARGARRDAARAGRRAPSRRSDNPRTPGGDRRGARRARPRGAGARSRRDPRDLPRGAHPSTPVAACGAPTGLDSGEPRWRR